MNKKRILIIGLSNRMGGVETFIYNTTIFSDKSKYQYDYLIHGSNECVFEKEINEFYKNEKHIYFIRNFKSNPFGCIKDLILFYKKNGKKYKYVHLQTGISSEVLYVFPYICLFKAKLISHSHNGNGNNKIENNLFKPLLRKVTSKYLACSKVASDWLFGDINKKRYTIINNGIDTERFHYSEENRKKIRDYYDIEDKFVIGHVGRFSVQKNHKFLIDIFEEVLKIKDNAVLLLLGVGEFEEEIKAKCKERNLDEKVIFAGKQSKTEEFYSGFDTFVMPSLYEGLPIVGIEAQATGLPCFFSNTIDNQILITDQAKIINLNISAKEWAKEICSVVINDKREMYSRVIEENGYGIRETVKILEEVYEVNLNGE